MAARWAHNPEGRFDSVATQPDYYSVNSTVGIHSTITTITRVITCKF
jgi:hypothetical protein